MPRARYGSLDDAVAAARPDIVVEATGVGSLAFGAIAATAAYGIVSLTGLSPIGRRLSIDAGSLNREIVLENDAVLGSDNANLDHYRLAAGALAQADLDWLGRVNRRVPLERFADAFTAQPDDVKVVLTLDGSSS